MYCRLEWRRFRLWKISMYSKIAILSSALVPQIRVSSSSTCDCDDLVILCKLERKAERALEVARQILESELKLSMSPEKTRITHFGQGFDFLGCHFRYQYVTPREKSLHKFKERVRVLTRRQQGKNLKQVLQKLVPVIRGWGNYHSRYHVKTLFVKLDKWIRMRLRAFIEKKKAVRHQNRRIPTRWLEQQGFVPLCSLLR